MGKILLILALGGLLALTMATAAYIWWRFGDVQIGPHGVLAMGLGVLVSLGLGCGLMSLVFYSSRKGYDDEQHRPWD